MSAVAAEMNQQSVPIRRVQIEMVNIIIRVLRLDRNVYAELKAQLPQRFRMWGLIFLCCLLAFLTLLQYRYAPGWDLHHEMQQSFTWALIAGLLYQLTWIRLGSSWVSLRAVERGYTLDVMGLSLIPKILGLIALSTVMLHIDLSRFYIGLVIFLPFLGGK